MNEGDKKPENRYVRRPDADREAAVRYLTWLLTPVVAYETRRGRTDFNVKALHVHSEVDELVDAAYPEGGNWDEAARAHFMEEDADLFLSAADLAAAANTDGLEGMLKAAEAKAKVLEARMAPAAGAAQG